MRADQRPARDAEANSTVAGCDLEQGKLFHLVGGQVHLRGIGVRLVRVRVKLREKLLHRSRPAVHDA